MQQNYIYAAPQDQKPTKGAEFSDVDLNIDDEELQSLLDILNNLSPEEQKNLETMGKELEKQMKDQNLDPNNPDDLFKWLELASPDEPEKKETKDKKGVHPAETLIKPDRPAAPPLELCPTSADPKAAKRMIRDTINNLTLVRQKISKYPDLSYKLERFRQELNELIYFLNVLGDKDLIKHLISKDFSKLHKNIACIHDILIAQEPNIQIEERELDVEDPYDVLKISHMSKQSDIEQAYKELKEVFDIDKLKQRLQAQGITGKDLNKRVKEAQISFKFIQDAYDLLSDPKQRSIVDRSLKGKFEAEKQARQKTERAFNKIFDTISSNMFSILKDIKQLLEKYKPEELKKAQEEEKKAKAIQKYQESPEFKKITRPLIREFERPKRPEYEEFYRQLAQEKAQREYAAMRPPMPPRERPEKEPTKPIDKDKKEAKPSDKKPADKKAEPKKDEKKEDKKGAPIPSAAPVTLTPQELDLSYALRTVGKLLDSTKDEIEIEKAGKKAKLKFKDAVSALDKYLAQQTVPNQKEVVKNFNEFVKVNKIAELAEELEKLSKEKITSPTLINNWKDISKKHNKKITDWVNIINPVLDVKERYNKKKGFFHPKFDFHNLKDFKKDYKKHLDDLKKKPAFQAVDYEESNLGLIKQQFKKIKESFDKINRTTAAGGPAKPATPPSGKPAVDDKSGKDNNKSSDKDKKKDNE